MKVSILRVWADVDRSRLVERIGCGLASRRRPSPESERASEPYRPDRGDSGSRGRNLNKNRLYRFTAKSL